MAMQFHARGRVMALRFLATAILSAVFLGDGAVSSSAQTLEEFVKAFSGKWVAFDDRYRADGQQCTIDLAGDAVADKLALKGENCAGELGTVETWGIVDNQLALFDAGGVPVVRLGGNQRRISGSTASDQPVILERASMPGIAAVLRSAAEAAGCYYLGFSDKCAPTDELSSPHSMDSKGDYKVKVVVNLNVRSAARADSEVRGVVPINTCLRVEQCVRSSDSVWCRAKFGEMTGWISKATLRQERWPIITFTNDCD